MNTHKPRVEQKEPDLKARMMAHWYASGLPLMVEALGEIVALESIISDQKGWITELHHSLERECADATSLARRNALLVIEIDNLKQALGLGTADEHCYKSEGLE